MKKNASHVAEGTLLPVFTFGRDVVIYKSLPFQTMIIAVNIKII